MTVSKVSQRSGVEAVTPSRKALDALRASIERVARAPGLPNRPASEAMVEALGAAHAAPAPPREAALDMVRRRLVAAAASPAGVRSAAPGDLRNAPWLLWAEREPLATLDGLLDAVLMRAMQCGRTRRNLIEAWLQGFSSRAPRIEEAGAAIRNMLAGDDARLDPWREADRKAKVFDPRQGPQRVAAALVRGAEPVEAVLNWTGLAERAVCGYARATHEEVLKEAPAALRSSATAFERIAAFLAPDQTLRFPEPETKSSLIRSLLAPWLGPDPHPDETTRAKIQNFLLLHMGDPRLRPEHWRGADEETALMRRWLAGASLRVFFDLIADHANEQWPYREAFWSACLGKDAISDAWLALGRRVHLAAGAIKELQGSFARMRGVGSDQSVLLLRVGPLVFCEWSHHGKLRAWPADWKTAPKLHCKEYDREGVTARGLPFPPDPRSGSRGAPDGHGLRHVLSEKHYWQGSAAKLLRQRAGVHLEPADWKPS